MKFRQKILNKYNQIKGSAQEKMVSATVEYATKKDILTRARTSKKEILKLSPLYVYKYSELINHLYHDFGITEMELKDGDGIEPLKDELDIKQTVKTMFKTHNFTGVDFGYTRLIKSWWILSTILQNYYNPLMKLKELSGVPVYKGIDFDLEIDLFEQNKSYIEDFTPLQKNG
jgi:hypothetical protein